MSAIKLNGITWGHSRGVTPLLAASQRYSELNPGVEISWQKRSLQEFADFPIEKLTENFDLLIIDHPWVGCAAATRCVLPLDEFLSRSYLENQDFSSVGGSHKSYRYGGSQWALAIDAAAPAASYRPDLLQQNEVEVPGNWTELLSLAEVGRVAIPAIPIDLLMTFYSFCIAFGHEPFAGNEEVIDTETGKKAIESMKELYGLLDKRMFDCNPIRVAEWMSSTDEFWYCPFAYCYSNYSRQGFAPFPLRYTDVISFRGTPMRTTIGGTGISVSASTKHQREAIAFAEMVCSPQMQSGIYVQNGGQPAHGAAWKDPVANYLTDDFFKTLKPLMNRGYIRPRFNGYLHFQDEAAIVLHDCIKNGTRAVNALEKMGKIYRESLLKDLTTSHI